MTLEMMLIIFCKLQKNSNVIILTAMRQQLGELVIEASLFNIQISSMSW